MEKDGIVYLTSSELGNLWVTYMNDSMTSRVLEYFTAVMQDEEIRPILAMAYKMNQRRLQLVKDIFQREEMPVPLGFTQQDVNVNAPRLYSDTFILHYVNAFSMMGIGVYGRCLGMAARADVRDLYTECVHDMTELYNESIAVLLNKGLYVRAPYMSIPKQVQFVQKKSYLGGLLSDHRALNALEISTLWGNILTNTLGKALIMGFSQVAKSKDVRAYFVRGKEIAKKHIKIFSDALLTEDIPSPITWDSDVKDSTIAPFSDKLMLMHAVGLNSAGLGNYGISMSSSSRADLTTMYARLMVEVGQYADDGAKILIENGWMEAPPQVEDRNKLAGV